MQYLRIYIRDAAPEDRGRPGAPALIVTETGVGYRLRLIDPPGGAGLGEGD